MDISLELTTYDDAVVAAFIDAQCKWTEIITGDSSPNVNRYEFESFPFFPVGWPCSNRLPPLVDDMQICAQVLPIDGPFNILGYAGPTFLEFSEEGHPFLHTMLGIMV